MLQVLGLGSDDAEHRADQHPGDQIAQHRAQPEAVGDRHHRDGGQQVDEGLDENAVHVSDLRRQPGEFVV